MTECYLKQTNLSDLLESNFFGTEQIKKQKLQKNACQPLRVRLGSVLPYGEVSELAEGARLEIVCTQKVP